MSALFAPIIRERGKPDEFRAKLGDALKDRMLQATEMHLAKLVLNTATYEVVVAGLIPDEFYKNLPISLRVASFASVGTDRIPVPDFSQGRIVGMLDDMPIEELVGFQWVAPEDELRFFQQIIEAGR
jgi:hypothetical protein